jgi:osmotically-inducible protein OsmY
MNPHAATVEYSPTHAAANAASIPSSSGMAQVTHASGDSPRRSIADRLLLAQVVSAIRGSCYPAVRRIVCHVQQRQVTLCGTVPSFYQKQIAQTLIWNQVGRDVRICNQLEVTSRERESSAAEARSGDQ